MFKTSLKSVNHLRCIYAKYSSQLTEKQIELMKKKLPQKKPIKGVNHIILVASGKGGVGKSTTAVNLATALKCVVPNKDVGLLDADVFGPSIPLMMNLHETPLLNNDNLMIPLINYGVKCMSMGNLITNQSAAIWRGLMVMGAIDKLIRDVCWDHTDYMIVDTPPGTGDTHLSLAQNLPLSGVVIVTTGQKAALDVTRRGITMYKKLNVPILGIVQNMSVMKCVNCSHENNLFGDSVQELAKQEEIEILFSIPLDPAITNGCDTGQPVVMTHPNSSQVKTYKSLAKYVVHFLDKTNSN
ncbi:P-loop containing nucleoside triphosphate hydrolase,Flagellum site-determining protein YlxH/ Fe-S [Cinara cedri]|uniref:P-loop containing nucleoside triphosphate hydrolase,Flagellum site-determining protein YlxH/ Fe-S n=1 Tax=Cinara cedri TaxID=506608 RepID=A0A5E4NAV3_9HEMI|nr:P-loop containing nucleoside triphosphate hydrolase,Flagellum site-determining protein YlxH/ Fe-S [Cinara cedri]